jgi:hypothetical protein
VHQFAKFDHIIKSMFCILYNVGQTLVVSPNIGYTLLEKLLLHPFFRVMAPTSSGIDDSLA